MTANANIRNFAIIAHVDHGKSTLADRMLEMTGTVASRDMQAQYLDSMDLERERGITIKANTVRLAYEAENGETYQLNLIDTPGHVDFAYEVSRSLSACEGCLLVVDAAQGVEAQTLANVYLAMENDLELIPVLNKVDLPGADPDAVREQIEDHIGVDCTHMVLASAKTGVGVKEVLEAIVEVIPAPTGDEEAPLQMLVIDSWYDQYQGVICLVRVTNGVLKKRQRIRFLSTGNDFEVTGLAVKSPVSIPVDSLRAGEVGLMITGIKDINETRVGDTVTDHKNPCDGPLEGFKPPQQMVFAGVFPVDPSDYENLREALNKLSLNDASFSWEPETSTALGFGFRCGFLGLLHMEIIQERLEREFNLALLFTAPNVIYKAHLKDGEIIDLHKPSDVPDPLLLEALAEPIILASIHVPQEYVGAVMKLCEEKRGRQQGLEYLSQTKVVVKYHLPFAEIVFDFYDKLKSNTRGYASLDYEFHDFEIAPLVKMDILVHGEAVDALSLICHRDRAFNLGQKLTVKLKEFIPRQMFEVPIQASLGKKVIARTTVRAFRKNVTAKCYGGDISRKRKLLEKQKKGKARMKNVGSVEIPQEAFFAVLRLDD
ncbi:MAG: translation elongation factor 4 [Deltaproteobacteria bacterium]|nr:translation elongation factor 4 [Deltaproteobacteria bacterium]